MLEEPPFDLLCPGRRPAGIGPVLLPADVDGGIDWAGFAHLLGRMADTSLVPAVNLRPGGVERIGPHLRSEVLATTGAALGGAPFRCGVRAEPGEDGGFDPAQLASAVEQVVRHRGTPVLLPSPTLATLGPDEHVGLVAWMGQWCDELLVVEAAPGRWAGAQGWAIDVFGALMEIEACRGVIHESGRRTAAWDRIRLRDEVRGDFAIHSAEVTAIDQIMYGTDHCLDLAAAVPDVIDRRDDAWEAEDIETLELQDALGALATMVFRAPEEAATHSLARILHLRGWLPHDRVVGGPPTRPPAEDDLLEPLLARLGI